MLTVIVKEKTKYLLKCYYMYMTSDSHSEIYIKKR